MIPELLKTRGFILNSFMADIKLNSTVIGNLGLFAKDV